MTFAATEKGGLAMKQWKDEQDNTFWEPDCADEWLEMLWEIGVDYDGAENAESLKALIDELVEIASKARVCLREGKIFPQEDLRCQD